MGFELVRRGIVLHQRDPKKTVSGYPTLGDVARLEDGRLFARWEAAGEGGPVTVCREWSEGEDPVTVYKPIPQDWWGWQREKKEQFAAGSHRTTLNDVCRDEDSEVARFCRKWPVVSSMLELAVPGDWPASLVDPGEIIYPRDLPIPRWREFLRRHASGDLGSYGLVAAEPITDPSTLWTMPQQPISVQARHCVDSGKGVVRSRHLPTPSEQLAWQKVPYYENAARTIDITTVYAAAKRTLVTLVLHNMGFTDAEA
jgi:hypothetical protein